MCFVVCERRCVGAVNVSGPVRRAPMRHRDARVDLRGWVPSRASSYLDTNVPETNAATRRCEMASPGGCFRALFCSLFPDSETCEDQ